MHTLVVIAAGGPFTPLFSTVKGLVAQAVTGLLSVVVGLATLVLIWNLIKAMTKNPSVEKLLALVAVAILAVVLAGAAPGLLTSSYQWGKDLGTNSGASLTAEAGQ